METWAGWLAQVGTPGLDCSRSRASYCPMIPGIAQPFLIFGAFSGKLNSWTFFFPPQICDVIFISLFFCYNTSLIYFFLNRIEKWSNVLFFLFLYQQSFQVCLGNTFMLIDLDREKDSKIWVKILHMTEGWVINSSHFKMKDVWEQRCRSHFKRREITN